MSMDICPMSKVNLSSSVKNYLYQYIRSLEQTGNMKLPPESELSLKLGVSRVTVRRALDELENEGIILRIQGRGTFVNPEALTIQVNLMPGEEFSRLIENCGYHASVEVKAVRRKEADLDLAKLNLSYTVLTAPYDGYMGRRTLEPGQYVQTGQTISYLVRNKDKWITANYKETQIANIYIGQQVRVKVDALPGKIFNGEVTAISEATGSKYSLVPTDNSAGNFVKVQQRIPVRIELENISSEEMAQLRAGMMVETEALRK